MTVRTRDVAQAPLGTPREVANYLQAPEKTLANWRYLGVGPRFIKVGQNVRYRWEDVEAWLQEQESNGGSAA